MSKSHLFCYAAEEPNLFLSNGDNQEMTVENLFFRNQRTKRTSRITSSVYEFIHG